MSKKKTAWLEIKNTFDDRYNVKRVEPGAFEISVGSPFTYQYLCMLVHDQPTGKWAATHNMIPNSGSSDYRYATALEAFQAYIER